MTLENKGVNLLGHEAPESRAFTYLVHLHVPAPGQSLHSVTGTQQTPDEYANPTQSTSQLPYHCQGLLFSRFVLFLICSQRQYLPHRVWNQAEVEIPTFTFTSQPVWGKFSTSL